MIKNKRFFTLSMPLVLAVCSLFTICDITMAAPKTASRGTAVARKSISNTTTEKKETVATVNEVSNTANEEPEFIIENKSNQFSDTISEMSESLAEDDSFAEQIRRQRNALAASEAKSATSSAQKKALATNSSTCDIGLRKCMSETCGQDFTKCALDGDTIFGDKLNKCKRNTECTGEEFSLFTAEIKADRDMNVRLASYNLVIDCGNNYNACIQKECGDTFSKCLGKPKADAAIQKCATIAKDCTESDSGLASRFGTAIGKLRENAEKDVKKDEERLYALRDLMSKQCKSFGAAFDERSFDCVYTVNFFAGSDQNVPTASRKRYAGDTFVCMQEWFGINATTFKENAYRETRSQTAASSAMLGSGLGTAAGLVSSGAIDRALATQKAKKDLKSECKEQGGKLKNGKCVGANETDENDDETEEEKTPEITLPTGKTSKNKDNNSNKKNDSLQRKDMVCTDAKKHHLLATYDENKNCIVKSCVAGYEVKDNNCVKKAKAAKQSKSKNDTTDTSNWQSLPQNLDMKNPTASFNSNLEGAKDAIKKTELLTGKKIIYN